MTDEPVRLEAADVCDLLLADRDAQIAQAHLERDVEKLHRERAEANYRAAALVALTREAKAAADAARARHADVVARVGKRYGVDWQTTAFRPETGELVPLPPPEVKPCP